MEIDIVFDGTPGHEGGGFVEVESPPGSSIRFGKWVQRDDGYTVLRFNTMTEDTDIERKAFMAGYRKATTEALTAIQRIEDEMRSKCFSAIGFLNVMKEDIDVTHMFQDWKKEKSDE